MFVDYLKRSKFQRVFFLIILVGWFLPVSAHGENSLQWEASFSYILDQHYLTVGSEQEELLTIGSALFNVQKVTSRQFFRASIMGNHGGHSPTRDLGDLQIVSNIDTEGVEAIRIYELLYGRFFGEWEVSLGWRDLSLKINVSEPALMFINSSFGTTAEWGATGYRGPSIYPFPSFGLYFDSHKFWDSIYLRGAVTDPLSQEHFYPKQMKSHIRLNSENHMAVFEAGWEPANHPNSAVAIGTWNMEIQQGVLQSHFSQAGLYFQANTQWGNHLQPFLRYGKATERPLILFENRVLGFKYSELFEGTDFGWGYSSAFAGGVETPEEVYEVTADHVYNSWLKFQLSHQVILNPVLGVDDGTLSTLRLFITL